MGFNLSLELQVLGHAVGAASLWSDVGSRDRRPSASVVAARRSDGTQKTVPARLGWHVFRPVAACGEPALTTPLVRGYLQSP